MEQCIEMSDLLRITEEINHNKDIDSLLDHILYIARKHTHADAGSIYLVDHGMLVFSYVQNDTLRKRDRGFKKMLYTKSSIPINDKSISGYAAVSGKIINLHDVYNLDPKLPFSFNTAFDKSSGYKTTSVLTMPLITSQQKTVGVIQLINAMNDKGSIIPFTEDHEQFLDFIANNASVAVERAMMTMENVLRMVQMSGLRDPKETGSHVKRVGSYSIEIYEIWAERHNISEHKKKHFKDILKIAAMLHDVGKVAIPDSILKKPAKLDDAEYAVMKTHPEQGAALFDPTTSELDALCHEIALSHHEKWDGSGYPKGLSKEHIPVSARICAIADVYDALVSNRVYKDKWDNDKIIAFIQENAGRHFDPEICDIFLEIYDVISAIREKFPDAENH